MLNKFFLPQVIYGKISGPKILIIGSIHGNENCGANTLEKIQNLELVKGSVTMIIGNPKAYKKNVRYVDNDLNRMFFENNSNEKEKINSYEYQRAQFLKGLIEDNDVTFDLHASTVVGSVPFAICENNADPFLKNLPIEYAVSGFDEVEPGGTDWFANSINKVGICVECGYFEDKSCDEIALQSCIILLETLGMIEQSNFKLFEKPKKLKVEEIYLTKNDFKLNNFLPDFTKIKANQTIGVDGKERIFTKKDGYILFAQSRQRSNEEAFLIAR